LFYVCYIFFLVTLLVVGSCTRFVAFWFAVGFAVSALPSTFVAFCGYRSRLRLRLLLGYLRRFVTLLVGSVRFLLFTAHVGFDSFTGLIRLRGWFCGLQVTVVVRYVVGTTFDTLLVFDLLIVVVVDLLICWFVTRFVVVVLLLLLRLVLLYPHYVVTVGFCDFVRCCCFVVVRYVPLLLFSCCCYCYCVDWIVVVVVSVITVVLLFMLIVVTPFFFCFVGCYLVVFVDLPHLLIYLLLF